MTEPPGTVHITYHQRMKTCQRATCIKCRSGTPCHGPYWYAYWRECGRVRSRYIGRQQPSEAAVRAADAPPKERSPQKKSAPVPTTLQLPPLRVQTLGGFALWRGEERVPVQTWGPRMRALFALMLECIERPKPREQVAEILWPDLAPAAAAKVLRDTLCRLRKVLGRSHYMHGYLPSRGHWLLLDPAPAGAALPSWWDAQTFRAAAATALAGHDLAQGCAALAVYGGEHLPGEELSAVEVRRAGLQHQYLALRLHQARTATGQAQPAEAEARLRQLLALEPAHEEAGQILMVLLAQSGRRAAALQVYQNLARALEDDLGIAPDTQTRRLAAQLAALARRTVGAQLLKEPLPLCGNLPHATTAFMGRVAARAAIADLLDEQRLVTLSGVGGIGKTCLAIQVGHDVLERYANGVWQVECAGLPASDANGEPGVCLLAPSLMHALGIEQRSDQLITTTLRTFLQPRRLLLILK